MKIVVPFRSDPKRSKKFHKNSKKIKKIPLWLHFKPKQVGKGSEREKIRIILPFRSYSKRDGKFQKNSKKIKNIKKKTIMALFQAKIGWKMPRQRENKNYRCTHNFRKR